MAHSTEISAASQRQEPRSAESQNKQVVRWGGIAGIAGTILLIGSALATVVFDLPDASDLETLTDYGDNETGRIVEHFLYLGALMAFAIHVFVLRRLLQSSHAAATLVAAVTAGFGFVILAASSVLHISTDPLAELYTDAETPEGDLAAIEYAWHGAQSVFDTMLAIGLLLVPIGMIFFGLAMRSSRVFDRRVAGFAIAMGAVGLVGSVVAIIVPGSMVSALAVAAIALFHVGSGWPTLKLADQRTIDLT